MRARGGQARGGHNRATVGGGEAASPTSQCSGHRDRDRGQLGLADEEPPLAIGVLELPGTPQDEPSDQPQNELQSDEGSESVGNVVPPRSASPTAEELAACIGHAQPLGAQDWAIARAQSSLTRKGSSLNHKKEQADKERGLCIAQTIVRDACWMSTTHYYAALWNDPSANGSDDLVDNYYATQDLNYKSVWSDEFIEWNIWLNQPWVATFFTATAWTLMANTLIEEPFNNRINFWDFNLHDVPHWVGHSIFFLCHGVLLALFILVFSCMWPTRHNWLAENLAKRSEQRWLACTTLLHSSAFRHDVQPLIAQLLLLLLLLLLLY